MDSPFSELPVKEAYKKSARKSDNFRTPFVDIASINESMASEQEEKQYEAAEGESSLMEANPSTELFAPSWEHQVVPGQKPQSIKIGDAILTTAESSIDQSVEYKEPVASGNPLFEITPQARKQHISPNFLVGEYAQANSGQIQWKYARIDPGLVKNVQLLRNFIMKSINIVDAYYSPKYLQDKLGVKAPAKIARDPHIAGRAAKLSVSGFDEKMLDIAVAAIVICEDGVHIGIGNSTMEISVKAPQDEPEFASYLKDEKVGQKLANFCVQFKAISVRQYPNYEKLMTKISGGILKTILQLHYGTPQDNVLAPQLADLTSIMHKESEPSDPYVILYCLAYSMFGNLYRQFLNDKSGNLDRIVSMLIEELGKGVQHIPNGQPFFDSQKKADKSEFIELCYNQYTLRKDKAAAINDRVKSFFDWRNKKGDKVFFDEVLKIVKETYVRNNYSSATPAQQLPEGGTKHELVKASPNPDTPSIDFTGRYFVEKPSDKQVYGRYLVVNQAGNYVSGKFGDIKRGGGNTIYPFYGKLDAKGIAIIPFVPQETIILKKNSSNQIQFSIIDNPTDKLKIQEVFSQRSQTPVISRQAIDAFKKLNAKNMELILTLAWVQPLPSQLKEFFDKLSSSQPKVEAAIKKYYSIDEDMPSVRRTYSEGAINDLDYNYLFISPPNFRQFIKYYTFYYYSLYYPWRPSDDKPFMTKLAWIKKMLEDFRGLNQASPNYTEKFKRLYDDFNVPTKAPDIEYEYETSMRLTSIGYGPFAHLSGTITIENKTDYKKFPNAHKWSSGSDKVSYSVSMWNASLSLDKWVPKLSEKFDMSAKGKSNVAYLESDFSGATIEVTEASLFELSAGGGGMGVSGSLTERVIIITGLGKGELTLEGTDLPIPDTATAKPNQKKDGEKEKFFEASGPSLGFYRGEINTKTIYTMIASVPLPSQFDANYQMQSTTYFQHDSALLSPSGIEAIGRMCAEEMVALSDSHSKLDIVGYADASGDEKYNKQLSEYRAINTLTAIKDRMGGKLKITMSTPVGMGEEEANKKYGQFTEKNAWLRRVVVTINGRAVLSLN
jgi:outer membrane protein OmpA-like peptidoglycan-associated protein